MTQEDKELYEKLNLIHSKIYDAYWLEKQGKEEYGLKSFKSFTDIGRIYK